MLSHFLRGAAGNAGGGIQYVGGYRTGFAGTTSNITISLTSLTNGLASAPASGDFVLVYFGTGSRTIRDLIINGYTEVAQIYGSDGYDANLVVGYKFMGVSPDTEFTLTGGTLSIDDAGAVYVSVWRNVDTTTPLDVTRTTATGSNTVLCDPPAITPITEGSYIIAGGAGAHASGTRGYSSSDLTDFRSVGNNDSNDVTIGGGYKEWISGAFDPAQFTFSGIDNTSFSWAAVTVALRPA